MPENSMQGGTPLLPRELLHRFVTPYFSRKKTYQSAVKKNGSPLWILETSVLEQNARRFTDTFNQFFPETAFYFAMKSNNHPDLSAVLLESGFGLDVSSGEELQTALALNARDIVFSGPGKTDDELALAVRHSETTTILLDSFGELERLERMVAGTDHTHPVRVGIRLTTNPDGLWRKFGIVPERLPTFWSRIKTLHDIHFKGLQFHSSWNLTPDRQIEFIILLGNILKDMPEDFNSRIEFIDIGGGYWPEEGEWLHFEETPLESIPPSTRTHRDVIMPHYQNPATSLSFFAQTLHKAINTFIFPFVNCRICFEPGRWICHNALHIFFTIIDKKSNDLVITDAGTNAIGWERFETDYFPVLNLSQSALQEKSCDILGSLCTPHDVWGYSYFGSDIAVGDLLMIPCQGAYTYSLRQNFIKPLPGFITL